MMPEYSVSPNNVHIVDSYTVPKAQFDRVLGHIQNVAPDCEVWKRSYTSLKLEWATHNFLYMLHMFRSHTKDVDLNYPQKWYITALYCICGAIGWIFIK